MEMEWLQELAQQHKGKILLGLGGFVVALMVIRFGFLWTVFIVLLTGTGYWIGKRLDEEPESLVRIFERMIPPGGR